MLAEILHKYRSVYCIIINVDVINFLRNSLLHYVLPPKLSSDSIPHADFSSQSIAPSAFTRYSKGTTFHPLKKSGDKYKKEGLYFIFQK